jgi:hypothetical protein
MIQVGATDGVLEDRWRGQGLGKLINHLIYHRNVVLYQKGAEVIHIGASSVSVAPAYPHSTI